MKTVKYVLAFASGTLLACEGVWPKIVGAVTGAVALWALVADAVERGQS